MDKDLEQITSKSEEQETNIDNSQNIEDIKSLLKTLKKGDIIEYERRNYHFDWKSIMGLQKHYFKTGYFLDSSYLHGKYETFDNKDKKEDKGEYLKGHIEIANIKYNEESIESYSKIEKIDIRNIIRIQKL